MERFGWKLVKCVYFLKCYYEIAICKLKALGVKKQMKMPSELILFDAVNTFVLIEIWSDFLCVCHKTILLILNYQNFLYGTSHKILVSLYTMPKHNIFNVEDRAS